MNFVSGYIGSDNHVIPHRPGESQPYDHLNSLLAKYDGFIQLLFRDAPIVEDEHIVEPGMEHLYEPGMGKLRKNKPRKNKLRRNKSRRNKSSKNKSKKK
jgi:hypothetical protein